LVGGDVVDADGVCERSGVLGYGEMGMVGKKREGGREDGRHTAFGGKTAGDGFAAGLWSARVSVMARARVGDEHSPAGACHDGGAFRHYAVLDIGFGMRVSQ
jgi:hypothetical protein